MQEISNQIFPECGANFFRKTVQILEICNKKPPARGSTVNSWKNKDFVPRKVSYGRAAMTPGAILQQKYG